jgi:methyl-accepting chemotaxis protein
MEPAALPTTGPMTARPPEARVGHAPGRPPKRKVRNFLLDTSLQLRLASYLLATATALSVGLGGLLYQAYRETSRVIALGDPDAGDSIEQALAREDRWRIVFVAVALMVVLVCLLGAAVVITHRIAGPAFVIGRTCRAVGEGNLARPRPLRNHDLLVDLADDVAAMVDALRDREGRERDAVLAALEMLRDPTAGPDSRAAAQAALERIAGDKEARLQS